MHTVSSIYFAAAIAAENELPPASKALIEQHDVLNREWARQGYSGCVPAALSAASQAIKADPLAEAAMAIRKLGNAALMKEWDAKDAKAA